MKPDPSSRSGTVSQQSTRSRSAAAGRGKSARSASEGASPNLLGVMAALQCPRLPIQLEAFWGPALLAPAPPAARLPPPPPLTRLRRRRRLQAAPQQLSSALAAMSLLPEDTFREKLEKLNTSQQSIETTSEWCRFYRGDARRVAEVGAAQELLCCCWRPLLAAAAAALAHAQRGPLVPPLSWRLQAPTLAPWPWPCLAARPRRCGRRCSAGASSPSA